MSEQGPWRVRAIVPSRPVLAGLAANALIILVAACGSPTVSVSPPSVAPSGAIGAPATSGPVTDPPPATSGPASSGPATDPPPAISGSIAPIVVDPTLLAVLPAQVDGVALASAPSAATEMITDAGLASSASGVAVAVAATGTATTDDFASVTVVRLRPGIFSEPFFAEWRRSYDEAGCAPAGGVAGHARQVIGARTVEVTTCAGGARILHVHLPGDVLVSIIAVGDRRLGDLVMTGLRE